MSVLFFGFSGFDSPSVSNQDPSIILSARDSKRNKNGTGISASLHYNQTAWGK
jgi:hypothetical protein